MMMFIPQFLLLFVICDCCIHVVALNITVDKSNGFDNSSCLESMGHCKTLDFVLNNTSLLECQETPIIILIKAGRYEYSLDATKPMHQFWKCLSISIIGISSGVSTINCSKADAGFAFFHSSKVMIQNISFQHCGSSQNGTSFNPSTNGTSMVSAALYFAFCQDVSIIESVINFSKYIGVVMYNTRTLNVTNSKFLYNRVNSSLAGGGGFYAEFTYCDPGFTNNCVQHSNSNAIYIFESSEFSFNAASDGSVKFNTFIQASGTKNIAFGRGGGISLIFKGNVSYSNVTLYNCTMNSNKATWGAGLFIEFQDNSNNNNVLVKNSKMDSNSCELNFQQKYGTGGGGARIGFISFDPYHGTLKNNTIAFENCSITNNVAYWGGGISYYTFREANVVNASNKVTFTSCSWEENRAVLGSAIDLSVWHPIKTGVLSTVLFTECTFNNNFNEPASITIYTENFLGTGAFYSDSIPVAFQKYVHFQNNTGSAMALSATSATFQQGCNSQFLNNRGWTGGAIALLGNAWLTIYDQTNFIFCNNSAILNGGAISVVISSRHDLLSSRNCFLQYHDQLRDPQHWNTSFTFINNTAPGGHGSSIFATSLLSCVWGNSTGELINHQSIKPFVNWNIFKFNNGDISNETSTEIAKILNTTTHPMAIAPGQSKKLPLNFEDDFNKTVNGTINLLLKHQDVSVVNSFTANNDVTLHGSPNRNLALQIVTDGPRIVSTTINVKLVNCPPGYILLSPTNYTYDKRCVCAYGHSENWIGILNCNDDKFRANIERDYWAGIINKSGNHSLLYTGKCPKNYCNTSRITLLPNSTDSLNRAICENQNRKGHLCGKCLNDNYCVAINSRYYKCTSNVHQYKWAIYLATEYLPSTILLVTILFYDINLHSESLGSVVMYFQVYSALNIYSDGEISPPKGSYKIIKGIDFLYNIWNLEYIGMWLNPYCLAKHLNTMQVLMIHYLSGVYPFLLIFGYILLGTFKRFSCCNPCVNFCIRLRWRTSLKASVINGLSTFWTLAYTKLALVSCLILTIGYLNGQNNTQGQPVQKVVFLQGDYKYFHHDHLPYAITALIVLVFFVILPSLALLCYPLVTRIMAKIKQYINLDGNRFYVYISGKMERPFIRFKPILDSFQGPYKPGCEFFAGLVYWYRLSIFLTYSFASHSKPFYINLVISIVFVTLISYFQPFREAKNNTVMLLITVNIALINSISLYNYYEVISDAMSWFQLVLVILPMIYFAICAAYGIMKKIKDYIRCAPPSGLYTSVPPTESQEFNDSLLHNVAEE